MKKMIIIQVFMFSKAHIVFRTDSLMEHWSAILPVMNDNEHGNSMFIT